jgi:hypothetical protein
MGWEKSENFMPCQPAHGNRFVREVSRNFRLFGAASPWRALHTLPDGKGPPDSGRRGCSLNNLIPQESGLTPETGLRISMYTQEFTLHTP